MNYITIAPSWTKTKSKTFIFFVTQLTYFLCSFQNVLNFVLLMSSVAVSPFLFFSCIMQNTYIIKCVTNINLPCLFSSAHCINMHADPHSCLHSTPLTKQSSKSDAVTSLAPCAKMCSAWEKKTHAYAECKYMHLKKRELCRCQMRKQTAYPLRICKNTSSDGLDNITAGGKKKNQSKNQLCSTTYNKQHVKWEETLTNVSLRYKNRSIHAFPLWWHVTYFGDGTQIH